MSIIVGASAAALCVLIGVVVGTISGFLGGAIDQFLMRWTEAFQVVPQFFLAAVLAALWGPRMVTLIIVIGLLGWPVVAKLVRTELMILRSRQYVSAARVQGRSALSIAAFEMLPNATGPIIVAGTILVGDAILLEAGLSYLGLGDPSQVSLGLMLFQSQSILQVAWWATVFPGAALTLIVISLNIVGDALNERLDPRIQRNTQRVGGV
jgi:peptide/nickel transport system permease protein